MRAIRGATTVESDTSALIRDATRELGWLDVSLFCTLEIPVRGALPRRIRVLLHVVTPASRAAIGHVYLRDARALRPDLAS